MFCCGYRFQEHTTNICTLVNLTDFFKMPTVFKDAISNSTEHETSSNESSSADEVKRNQSILSHRTITLKSL